MTHLLEWKKDEAAAYLKKLIDQDYEEGDRLLNEMLDKIMEPTHLQMIRRGQDLGEWMKNLYGGGETFEKFCAACRVFDKSPYCGCVWTANFVAYRCKTCATSPCMSVCAACFENGNHEGHEYNIFRSEAGGACDCGDSSVMKESGFCSHHGVNRVVPEDVPPDLLTMPKILMRRSLLLVMHTCRNLVKGSILESSFPSKIADPISDVIDVLIEVMKCGSITRAYVAYLLLDEDYYRSLIDGSYYCGLRSEEMIAFQKKCIPWFPAACRRLPMSKVPDEISNKERFGREGYEYKCFLQELMFWTVRFEFQEPLILLLLNMLPESKTKQAFARTFVRHYLYIAPSLSGALHVEMLSNRIVHISVQLFSNNQLAYTLAKDEGLLEVFMISLHHMVTNKLVKSTTNENDLHQCVATAGRGLKNNCYWAIVSDLVNCLGHNNVAKLFLNNDELMQCWMRILLCFTGMNLTSREMDKHVEYDPQHILLSFYSEREACAAPLWVILDVLKDATTLPLAEKFIYKCLKTINEFLDVLGISDEKASKVPFNLISFHYPVHRYFALFAANAVSRQGLGMGDLQMTEGEARRTLAHSLMVLCTSHEIHSNLWVRNGLNISTQQLAYKQSFFCTFFIDADLFMFQLCSCYMSPELFINTIIDRCRVAQCFSPDVEVPRLPPSHPGHVGQPEDDKMVKMVESVLYLLAATLSITTHLGISDKKIIDNELVALLSTQSLTHSGITEHIPQCHDLHAGEKSRRFSEPLTQAIEDLTVTVEGDAMTQTHYTLKEEAWKFYDPIFTAHRAMYKKNVQQSHTNYFKHLQRLRKLPRGTLEGNVWPPYQLIRITDERYEPMNRLLNSRALHSVIFLIIFKYTNGHPTVSEQALVLAIHLLEAALFAAPSERKTMMEQETQSKSNTSARDFMFPLQVIFSTDNMAINIRQIVDQIQVPPTEEIFHDAMETDEQRKSAPDLPHDIRFIDEPEKHISVQESILTMLIKLHDKFSGLHNSFIFPAEFIPDMDPPNPVPPTAATMVAKILLFAASKSPENQKFIIEKCGTTPPEVEQPIMKDPKLESERERRKKKAKEMQEKLLAEFALKQKLFLERNQVEMDLYGSVMDDEMHVDPAEEQVDCVICGTSADTTITVTGNTETERKDSARNQIIGLVCLIQSSTVLGFRTDQDENRPMRPPKQDVPAPETCRSLQDKTTENFRVIADKNKYNFDFSLGHNIEWEQAPHISTCGHHLHVGCHQNYMEWVQKDETGYLRFESGLGFQCPVCRQTSNIVIPCNVVEGRPVWPENIRKNFKTYKPDPSVPADQHSFYRALVDIQNFLGANVPKRTMMIEEEMETEEVSKDEGSPIDPPPLIEVSVLTHDELVKACKSITDDILTQNKSTLHKEAVVKLDLRGVLRGQLEYDLTKCGSKLVRPEKPTKLPIVMRRIPVGPCFNLICRVARVEGDTTNNEFALKLWNQLNGVLSKFSYSQCPLLVKDPISLLFELCIALYPLSVSEYQIVVRLLYNLAFVQTLVQLSCKFSPEERSAWKSKCDEFASDPSLMSHRLDYLLGHVIDKLPPSLFGDDLEVEGQGANNRGFTSTVWSPECVKSYVENSLMHFLRSTALLQFHVFKDPGTRTVFPCAPFGENEFVFLAKYLGMVAESLAPPYDDISTQVLKWPTTPRSMVTQWCKEIESVVSVDRKIANQLLTRHRAWRIPAIVDIPPDYTQLFTQFRDITCANCKYLSREPAMCLVCGQFVCYKGMCQHARDFYNEENQTRTRSNPRGAAIHAKNCGNGTVILLNVHMTTIIVVRGPRSTVWGTLYLDQHGEEDRGWKRGRKLMLKKERLDFLNHQWVNHMFDNSCRNWTMHRNQM